MPLAATRSVPHQQPPFSAIFSAEQFSSAAHPDSTARPAVKPHGEPGGESRQRRIPAASCRCMTAIMTLACTITPGPQPWHRRRRAPLRTWRSSWRRGWPPHSRSTSAPTAAACCPPCAWRRCRPPCVTQQCGPAFVCCSPCALHSYLHRFRYITIQAACMPLRSASFSDAYLRRFLVLVACWNPLLHGADATHAAQVDACSCCGHVVSALPKQSIKSRLPRVR